MGRIKAGPFNFDISLGKCLAKFEICWNKFVLAHPKRGDLADDIQFDFIISDDTILSKLAPKPAGTSLVEIDQGKHILQPKICWKFLLFC